MEQRTSEQVNVCPECGDSEHWSNGSSINCNYCGHSESLYRETYENQKAFGVRMESMQRQWGFIAINGPFGLGD